MKFISLLFLAVPLTAAQKITLYDYDDPIKGYAVDEQGNRMLQRAPDCKLSSTRMLCTVYTSHSATDSNQVNQVASVTASLNCAFDPAVQTDFRRAQDCYCTAQVVSPGDDPKECACSLCPSGYGTNPIKYVLSL